MFATLHSGPTYIERCDKNVSIELIDLGFHKSFTMSENNQRNVEIGPSFGIVPI